MQKKLGRSTFKKIALKVGSKEQHLYQGATTPSYPIPYYLLTLTMILVYLESNCQVRISFRLGHEHQGRTNKPWSRRRRKNPPLVPKNEAEAYKIIERVIEVAGLPPLESIYQLLINSKGGAL